MSQLFDIRNEDTKAIVGRGFTNSQVNRYFDSHPMHNLEVIPHSTYAAEAADDLLAYAECEEARSRGEDIAETVLKRHGWDRTKGTAHDFMDAMRRVALAKARGQQ